MPIQVFDNIDTIGDLGVENRQLLSNEEHLLSIYPKQNGQHIDTIIRCVTMVVRCQWMTQCVEIG